MGSCVYYEQLSIYRKCMLAKEHIYSWKNKLYECLNSLLFKTFFFYSINILERWQKKLLIKYIILSSLNFENKLNIENWIYDMIYWFNSSFPDEYESIRKIYFHFYFLICIYTSINDSLWYHWKVKLFTITSNFFIILLHFI